MRHRNGFTIIELLIVFAIIGIIAAIAIPSLMQANQVKNTPAEAYAVCNPQLSGGNVWRFVCNDGNFAKALGQFRMLHPELRIVTVAAASREGGQYAATVVTEPRLPAEAP